MGYSNPAFVDDDNESSNTRTTIRLNDKRTTATNTNEAKHKTTVNNGEGGLTAVTPF